MFVVAIIELATSIDEEALRLAPEVGMSVYDLRLRLTGMLPAVVMMTPDGEAAGAVLRAVRSRGHGAVGCDLQSVVPSTSMVRVCHFILDDVGLRVERGSRDVLPYGGILALVQAAHPELHQIIGHELVFVSPRQGVRRRETLTNEHDAPQSLYIFRGDGETPWILQEREAHYPPIGGVEGPVQHLNFLGAIRALRARAPQAYFDDRFVSHLRSPEHFTRSFGRSEGGTSPWADHGADLGAHLLALWFASRAAAEGSPAAGSLEPAK